jgi:arylsulfatase A-like enzyme
MGSCRTLRRRRRHEHARLRVGAAAALLVGLAGAAPLAASAAGEREARGAPPRPHIVILLADDLGWADVGYHGGGIPTPHIDALAASGVRLEHFYVWPVCSPTRAALLTGRYPIRYGLQGGVVVPHATFGLPVEERTLAAALREVGYRTAIVGKWHLGHAAPQYLPLRRGFDHQYGHYNGQVGYYSHRRLGGLDWHRDGVPLEEEGYATELVGREAVRLIEGHDPATPLFLYLPFLAPHAPIVPPRGSVESKASVRAKYGAMVQSMDQAIGAVLAALEARGMREHTLVLFTSDNGGLPDLGASNAPLRGGKYTPYEGGVRVPAVASWPGHLPAGAVREGMAHVVDWYPTLLGLAGASLDQPLALDGLDLWPMLAEGGPSPRQEMLLLSFRGWEALRVGRWKLIQHYPKLVDQMKRGERVPDWASLYDIEADPTESHSLIAGKTGIFQDLAERLKAYYAASARELRAGRKGSFEAPAVWGVFPDPDAGSAATPPSQEAP